MTIRKEIIADFNRRVYVLRMQVFRAALWNSCDWRRRIAADAATLCEGFDPGDMPNLSEEEGLPVTPPGKKGGGGVGV